MNPTKLSRRLAALLALCACAVQAEIMDDVEVRREGNNAVLMIRMTTPMTLVRSTVSRSKDLTQAYYRIKSTTERPQFVEGERRIVEVDGLPVVTIVDEPVRTDFLRDPNRRLVIAFSRAAKFKVRAGKGDRVLEVVIDGLGAQIKAGASGKPPAPAGPLPAADAAAQQPGVATSDKLDPAVKAREGYAAAQLAFEQQKFELAVTALNQILEMASTPVTPDALELLGKVRLAQGQTDQARIEFESYLKQYPDGPGAERVRAALAAMPAATSLTAVVPQKSDKPDGSPTITGSIAQYYYGGQSTVDTQAVRDTDGTLLSPDQIDRLRTGPISSTDQQLLSNSMDMTWRSLNQDRDIKFVTRDQYDYNLIDDSKLSGKSRHRNRLSAMYLDYKLLKLGASTRVGRQSANWGGEGRYDGLSGSYVFRPKWKASAAFGVPTDSLASSQRYFYGFSVDADALTPNVGGSMFLMQRMIDGEVDRRSVGVDLRYFTQSMSVMGSTDYDLIFRRLNSASIQGMYMAEGNTTVNVLVERRSLAQAALGQALFFQFSDLQLSGVIPKTIDELKRSNYSVAQLRELIRANTTYSNHAMASVTTPLSPQWQVGLDVHLNSIGAISPNPVLPDGQPDSGQQRTVGLQLIGTNLYSTRDTHVLSGSVMSSSLVKVRQVSYNNMSALGESWQIEPSVRWQESVSADVASGLDVKATSWGPGLKISYKPRPAVVLESNFNADFSQTEGVTNNDKSTRFSYFIGYRYTFD
jgi:TolA-binding protein